MQQHYKANAFSAILDKKIMGVNFHARTLAALQTLLMSNHRS
jgi:hypothetical protein